MEKKVDISGKKKIVLDRYEVSVMGVMFFTLLFSVGILTVQAYTDAVAYAEHTDASSTYMLHNYRIYLVTAIVFLLSLIVSGILCKRCAIEIGIPVRLYFIGGGIVFVLHLLLLMKCYLNSPTVYPAMSGEWFPWHSKTNWKMFVFMAVIGMAGILAVLWAEKKSRWVEILRYPAYLLAAAVAGFSMYCGNFLVSDKLHGNSYYTSVYNALMNAPYDYSNQSIYGHYAILLKLPIKILGGDYTAFNIVMAFIGGISVLILALALDLCLKNHIISIIGVWSIPLMYFYYPLNHWQMFPHRVLFAGIELYLLARYFHTSGKFTKVVGYVLCSLALLWNVETGIVCLGVWALICVVHDNFYEKSRKKVWKDLLISLIRNMAYSIIAVLGMVGIFNLYNMPLGEGWHGLRFLLFPHISSWDTQAKLSVQAAEHMKLRQSADMTGILLTMNNGLLEKLKTLDSGFASGLASPFPVQISSWYFVFILLGAAIILLSVRRLYLRENANDYVMGLAAILGLGQLVYFINRPCFDYLAIAFFESVLIMGILADETVDKEHRASKLKKIYQMLLVAIMSVLSVLSVWQIVFRISDRIESGYYEVEKMDSLIEDIRQTVPRDTMAFGQGVQEIYAQLGWDTGCYFVDFSSLSGNDHSLATIIVRSAEQSECMISVRGIEEGQKISAQRYMSYWGFPEAAITVKKQWEMGMDFGGSYWDLYYIGINQDIDNPLTERFEEIYREDRSTRWK